jgi:hypothetical protein
VYYKSGPLNVCFSSKNLHNSGHAQPAVQCAPALMQLSEFGVDVSTNVTIAGDSRC